MLHAATRSLEQGERASEESCDKAKASGSVAPCQTLYEKLHDNPAAMFWFLGFVALVMLLTVIWRRLR